MARAAIAAYLGQALDVQSHSASEVTLDDVVLVNALTESGFLSLGEILDSGIGIDAGFLEDLLRARSAYAVNVGQADLCGL